MKVVTQIDDVELTVFYEDRNGEVMLKRIYANPKDDIYWLVEADVLQRCQESAEAEVFYQEQEEEFGDQDLIEEEKIQKDMEKRNEV